MTAKRSKARKRASARTASTKKNRAKVQPRARPEAAADAAVAKCEPRALPVPPKAKRARNTPKPVTRAWVLERLAENVRRAMRIEAVTLRGVPTGEYRYEGSIANRALELLGKELGLFVERSESVNTHHVVSGEPISEAKWEEQYAKTR